MREATMTAERWRRRQAARQKAEPLPAGVAARTRCEGRHA